MNHWTTDELEVLKNHHHLPRLELTRVINEWRSAKGLPPRTFRSVSHAAWKLRPVRRSKAWTEPEILFLERNCGHPLTQLHQYFNRHGRTQGWPVRTKTAIRKQLYNMGLCCDAGEYLSLSEISRHLQVSHKTVQTWISHHSQILAPVHDEKGTYVHKKRLKAFIIKFPGELEPRTNREQFYLNLLRDSAGNMSK